MFDLPHIERIDDDVDVSAGAIQPFEHGYITTWVGRRKTPFGHRLSVLAVLLDGFVKERVQPNSSVVRMLVKHWKKLKRISTD